MKATRLDSTDTHNPLSYLTKFNFMLSEIERKTYQTKYPELYAWDIPVQNLKPLPIHAHF